MQPELRSGLELGPKFKSPNPENMNYEAYLTYTDTELPPESPPQFGLHSNAEIGYLTSSTTDLFATIMSLGGGGGGGGEGINHDDARAHLHLPGHSENERAQVQVDTDWDGIDDAAGRLVPAPPGPRPLFDPVPPKRNNTSNLHRELRFPRPRARGRIPSFQRARRRRASSVSMASSCDDVCAQCLKPPKHTCSRCKAVRYCSAACQRKHWPTHRAACGSGGPRIRIDERARPVVLPRFRVVAEADGGGPAVAGSPAFKSFVARDAARARAAAAAALGLASWSVRRRDDASPAAENPGSS